MGNHMHFPLQIGRYFTHGDRTDLKLKLSYISLDFCGFLTEVSQNASLGCLRSNMSIENFSASFNCCIHEKVISKTVAWEGKLTNPILALWICSAVHGFSLLSLTVFFVKLVYKAQNLCTFYLLSQITSFGYVNWFVLFL